MNKEKAMRVSIVCIGAILCILFVFLLVPRLIGWFLPFVLAYILAKIIDPLVNFLHNKLRLPRQVGAVVGIILALAVIGGLIYILIEGIINEVNTIVSQSDVIMGKMTEKYHVFRDSVATKFGLAASLDRWFASFGQKFGEFVANYTAPVLRGAFSVVLGVPSMIIFMVVFLLATFFISSDRDKIRGGVRKLMPQKVMDFTDNVIENVFSALGAYIKAQLILICITFCELLIGFLVIGGNVKNYALILALVISIIDAIPILGTGTVLIPWGVYAVIVGDTRLGIMLLVLYLICLTVRQITEPRLVAHQIGIHPLVILMVMYTGLRTMGFFGMILGPIVALIIKRLYASGAFSIVTDYIRGETRKE